MVVVRYSDLIDGGGEVLRPDWWWWRGTQTWLMVVVRYSDDGGAWNFSMLSREATVYGSNLCTTLTEVAMPNTSTRGRNVTWFLTYDRASTQSQQRCLAFSITTSTYTNTNTGVAATYLHITTKSWSTWAGKLSKSCNTMTTGRLVVLSACSLLSILVDCVPCLRLRGDDRRGS